MEEILEKKPTETNKEIITSQPVIVDKVEQARTIVSKRKFLEIWKKSTGVVSVSCAKAEINRETYYRWLKEDPEFAEAVKEVEDTRLDVAEEILFEKVFIEKDKNLLKFYLERRSPAYRQKLINEIYAGKKTMEDLYDEAVAENTKIQQEHDQLITGPDRPEQRGDDQALIEDQGQEGTDSATDSERSPELLPEQAAPAQPDTQSPPKGIEQDH
jgi:hypothetical protein